MNHVPRPFHDEPFRRLAEFVLVPPDGCSVGICKIGNHDDPAALERMYGRTETGYRDSVPREAKIDTPFFVMRYPVTNMLFSEFVRARHIAGRPYVTTAERVGRAWALDGQTWTSVSGACWRCPSPIGPPASQRPFAPVTCVTWDDANEFAQWLTEANHNSRSYRLPTEVEWEFACRAGSADTAFWWGDELDDEHAIHRWSQHPNRSGPEDVEKSPIPGRRRCNSWGLSDMLGNVWEWCDDRHTVERSEYAVVRGGSWGSSSCAGRMLCSFRGRINPADRGDRNGFRLVCDPGSGIIQQEGTDDGADR